MNIKPAQASNKHTQASKTFTKLLGAFIILFFIALVVQLSILTIRFGSGHWVTICSAGQGDDINVGYGTVYFTNAGFCSKQDSPKITVWVKDPWPFNINFFNFLNNPSKSANAPNVTSSFTPTPSLSLIPKPKPTATPIAKFSITVLTHLDLSNYKTEDLNISMSMKNISVKPFITGFRFTQCSFVDETNTVYQGEISVNNLTSLQKAILPGEERTISNVPIYISIIGLSSLGQKCGYDTSGSFACKTVGGLKVAYCNAQVYAGPTDASSIEPVRVNFP